MILNKIIVTICLFFTALNSVAQHPGKYIEDSIQKLKALDSIIVWERNRKLTPADFKGIPEITSQATALSYCQLIPILEIEDEFKADVICVFDKTKSWAKINTLHAYELSHEQCHFDISQFYAKKMAKELSNLSLYDPEINAKISAITIRNYKSLDSVQELYDYETSHKYDTTKQFEWSKKMNSILRE